MSLKVNEIFYSIQGESTYSGLPCIFIRLTGCNLRCSYCDTTYAYEEGNIMEIHDILSSVRAYDCALVEITGGEPLLQPHTPHLVKSLLKAGYHVLLETNGTQDISQVDDRCVRIMDVKCPSSGFDNHNDWENFTRLTVGDEIKFVISDQKDYQYAKEILKQFNLDTRKNPVHFSPVTNQIELATLAGWILHDHLPIRLHPQLHKIIWGPQKKGV